MTGALRAVALIVLAASCGGRKDPPALAAGGPPAAAKKAAPPVDVDRSKDADAVVARFDLPGDPPPPVPPDPARGEAVPVYLVATHVSADAELSFATIVDRRTGGGGFYALGDDIPAAGRVVAIAPRHVAFMDAGGARRTLDLVDRAAVPARDTAAAPPAGTLRRAELAELRPEDAGARVRVEPRGGVKLYAVRSGGLAHRLGFQNGDRLVAIDGVELTSPDAALKAWARLRSADRFDVQLVRGGQPLTLTFTVVE